MKYYIPSAPTKYIAFDVPFSFRNGGAAYVDLKDRAYWKNKVASVAATELGERVMRPTYGASLTSLVNFETAETIMGSISEAISEALRRWIPEINFSDVTGTYNYQTGTVTLTVAYTTPDNSEESVKIKTGSISSSEIGRAHV